MTKLKFKRINPDYGIDIKYPISIGDMGTIIKQVSPDFYWANYDKYGDIKFGVALKNIEILEDTNMSEIKEIIDLPALTIESQTRSILPSIEFDKTFWIKRIDEMAIEDLTPGFIKQIKDAAIAIDKRLYAPIKAWRDEVDEIIAHINNRRAALVAEAAKIEAARKAAKETEVASLLIEVLENSMLNDKYKAQLTILDKYLNKTETINKIKDDLIQRVVNLKLQQDNEELAEKSRIEQVKNRELLIENLNARYQKNFKYSSFDINVFNDDEVQKLYDELVKAPVTEVKQEETWTPSVTMPIPYSRTVKITGASLEAIDKLIVAIRNKGFEVKEVGF